MTFDNLKTAWSNRITAQYTYDGDAIAYQTALINLDLYVLALTTESNAVGDNIQSYSIGGQSVTKYGSGTSTNNSQNYLRKIQAYCGRGGMSVDDFSYA